MLRRLSAGVNNALSIIAPERRVILRSETSTSYHRLSPLAQTGLVALGVVMLGSLGGLGYHSVTTSLAAAKVESREDALRAQYETRIAALEAERLRLADDLSEARNLKSIALSKLTHQHSSLSNAVATELELASALQTHQSRLDSLAGEHEATVEVCEATTNRVTALKVDLHRMEIENRALADTVEELNTSLAAVADQRDNANAGEIQLTMRLEDLNAELAEEASRRDRILDQLEEAAALSLGAMESVLEKSGVAVDPILDAVRQEFSGQGGPFLPADEVKAMSKDTGEVGRIAPLMSNLERLNLLRIAVERLPFAKPVGSARLTSKFGSRRDPVNGRKAHHAGIDYAAPRGTAIYATAGGKVVKASWSRGYGKTIKIKHDFGYETVYAHLHRFRVKVGDVVERGDRIGDMGNTGRSTGTHLHYEVRTNGVAVNPAKYIEAARHVL